MIHLRSDLRYSKFTDYMAFDIWFIHNIDANSEAYRWDFAPVSARAADVRRRMIRVRRHWGRQRGRRRNGWLAVSLQFWPSNTVSLFQFDFNLGPQNFEAAFVRHNLGKMKPSFTMLQLYDNKITSLIDIYFLRISFIPSKPFRHPVRRFGKRPCLPLIKIESVSIKPKPSCA
jgi:hypothetical protein